MLNQSFLDPILIYILPAIETSGNHRNRDKDVEVSCCPAGICHSTESTHGTFFPSTPCPITSILDTFSKTIQPPFWNAPVSDKVGKFCQRGSSTATRAVLLSPISMPCPYPAWTPAKCQQEGNLPPLLPDHTVPFQIFQTWACQLSHPCHSFCTLTAPFFETPFQQRDKNSRFFNDLVIQMVFFFKKKNHLCNVIWF